MLGIVTNPTDTASFVTLFCTKGRLQVAAVQS